MKDAHEGIDKTVEGGGTDGYDEAALAMPEEYPELERPPLRKIDKYCMPEVPCVPISKRFTQVGGHWALSSQVMCSRNRI